MKNTETKRQYEKRIVSEMIALYCKKNHHTDGLCEECAKLNDYAIMKTERCRFMDEKSFCSNCQSHCYKPEMRQKIREVMRFSGPRMLFHHPVMAVKHLIATKKEAKRLQAEAEAKAFAEDVTQTDTKTNAK